MPVIKCSAGSQWLYVIYIIYYAAPWEVYRDHLTCPLPIYQRGNDNPKIIIVVSFFRLEKVQLLYAVLDDRIRHHDLGLRCPFVFYFRKQRVIQYTIHIIQQSEPFGF